MKQYNSYLKQIYQQIKIDRVKRDIDQHIQSKLFKNQTNSEIRFKFLLESLNLKHVQNYKIKLYKQRYYIDFIIFFEGSICLCIEIDGGYHKRTKKYDKRREKQIKRYFKSKQFECYFKRFSNIRIYKDSMRVKTELMSFIIDHCLTGLNVASFNDSRNTCGGLISQANK